MYLLAFQRNIHEIKSLYKITVAVTLSPLKIRKFAKNEVDIRNGIGGNYITCWIKLTGNQALLQTGNVTLLNLVGLEANGILCNV